MKLWRVVTLAALGAAVAGACNVDGPGGGGGEDDDGTGATTGDIDPTPGCEMTCIAKHPTAEVPYRDLRNCLTCSACPTACGATMETCPTMMPDTCSGFAMDCASCIDSPCALEQLNNTMFSGTCAAQGTTCSNNIECVALNNCVSSCVANVGMGGGGAGPTSSSASSSSSSSASSTGSGI